MVVKCRQQVPRASPRAGLRSSHQRTQPLVTVQSTALGDSVTQSQWKPQTQVPRTSILLQLLHSVGTAVVAQGCIAHEIKDELTSISSSRCPFIASDAAASGSTHEW